MTPIELEDCKTPRSSGVYGYPVPAVVQRDRAAAQRYRGTLPEIVHSAELAVPVKPLAAGFRLVAGEQGAEWRQGRRLFMRIHAWDNRRASTSCLDLPWTGGVKFAYARRLALLNERNERLETENAALRRIAAMRSQPNEIKGDASGQEGFQRVAELLAILGDDDGDLALTLFDCGQLSVHSVVERLGSSDVVRFSNMLGWSGTGYLQGDTFFSTELGKAVGLAVSDIVSQPRA